MFKLTISGSDKMKKFFFIALFFNIALLLAHLTFMTIFYVLDVKEIFYISIACIVFHSLCFFFIYKDCIQTFLLLVVLEINVHIVITTLLIGWNSGFPLYYFGLIMIIYYTKYIYNDKKMMKPIPITVSILSIVEFLLLRLFTFSYTPHYYFAKSVLDGLYLFNCMLIFMLVMISLIDYTKIVLDTENRLREIADHDELTKTYSRRKIHEVLKDYHRTAEKGRQNFCISIIDVDNFKGINDGFGHDVGDYVLKKICSNIRKLLSAEEKKYTDIARWGGDEFLIVQKYDGKKVTLEQCRGLIYNIQSSISAYSFMSGKRRLPVSLTIGFASHNKGDSIDETFKTADENLYKGKLKGKNIVVF